MRLIDLRRYDDRGTSNIFLFTAGNNYQKQSNQNEIINEKYFLNDHIHCQSSIVHFTFASRGESQSNDGEPATLAPKAPRSSRAEIFEVLSNTLTLPLLLSFFLLSSPRLVLGISKKDQLPRYPKQVDFNSPGLSSSKRLSILLHSQNSIDRFFDCEECRHKTFVGETGFEPATSWSQTKRSSRAELLPE